ncbi:hypothetical protein PVAP13_3KG517800 [Panicum virgatum]|uniref:Uncharacterized protein n=1 Tax=Panicum virgatum TaxID=38727 RepID=A0A8T0V9Q8_PANVG|nr:hypothetical protein PVAP13_3KG517800 [Panicum virgatum]KAG2630055.1 hypothetical protein PVAP13_3KG517800 [Panicum virgatum]
MSGLHNEKEPSLQYGMKVLAVDIPMESGPDQRLFLVGDEQEYKVSGALISSLSEDSMRCWRGYEEDSSSLLLSVCPSL